MIDNMDLMSMRNMRIGRTSEESEVQIPKIFSKKNTSNKHSSSHMQSVTTLIYLTGGPG